MDLHYCYSALILCFHISLLHFHRGAFGASFTFVNKCDHTVWPGILASAGSPPLATTGFELPQHSSRKLPAPSGWSGRFWARTGCTFSDTSTGSCRTGDCGSGQPECNGSGATPPATLAEITLGTAGLDFYDVSLVDGYNLPMLVEAAGGSGMCAATGCVADLNRACPSELRSGGGEACRSACEAFGRPEYCCSGAYNSPTECKPSVYSKMFKSACPRSYSYAYDDRTSTFTCSGADYTVTFCPSMPSQKSSEDSIPAAPGTTNDNGNQSGSDPTGTDGSDSGSSSGSSESGPESEFGSSSQAMLADGSWMAGLAMGDSTRAHCPSAGFIASTILVFIHLFHSNFLG